jgi:hypothetical protein
LQRQVASIGSMSVMSSRVGECSRSPLRSRLESDSDDISQGSTPTSHSALSSSSVRASEHSDVAQCDLAPAENNLTPANDDGYMDVLPCIGGRDS